MRRHHLAILVSILSIIGLSIFSYKYFVMQFPLFPDLKTETWDVEVRVEFEGQNKPVKLTMYLPQSDQRYWILDERFVSQGFGLSTRRKGHNRIAIWSQRKTSGQQVLYYRATVRPASPDTSAPAKQPAEPQKVEFDGAHELAAESILQKVRARSADIDTLVSELLTTLNPVTDDRLDDNARILLGKNPSLKKRLEVVQQLLNKLGIPARLVFGYRLTTLMRDAVPAQWLEVFHDAGWQSYDPRTAQPGVSPDLLAWQRDDDTVAKVSGGTALHTQVSIALNRESALRSTTWQEGMSKSLFYDFSLLSMPIDVSAVYHVLLTIPLGVLLLIVLRNVIGIKTFGTFMPVLIAMAFRETQLVLGVVLFSLIVGLGLSVRFYLEQLKLLLVPRLAAVLIIVIIMIIGMSILSHKLGLPRGLSITLFPIVIMTMTIERMTIVWEERGAPEALQQGIGSLFAAALAYLVMNLHHLQHLVFIFPEILLLILALVLLLGRYTGYRLLELFRFKALAK